MMVKSSIEKDIYKDKDDTKTNEEVEIERVDKDTVERFFISNDEEEEDDKVAGDINLF